MTDQPLGMASYHSHAGAESSSMRTGCKVALGSAALSGPSDSVSMNASTLPSRQRRTRRGASSCSKPAMFFAAGLRGVLGYGPFGRNQLLAGFAGVVRSRLNRGFRRRSGSGVDASVRARQRECQPRQQPHRSHTLLRSTRVPCIKQNSRGSPILLWPAEAVPLACSCAAYESLNCPSVARLESAGDR